MQPVLAPPTYRPEFYQMLACSDAMLPVLDRATRAAESDAAVLITGESGTGKELVAEAIHAGSPRRHGPFVIVNMAAVPGTLIESELFGHVAGAFTGADRARIGRFEAADGGTLFIDEIGDLAVDCQAKLLRVLENHRVTPVGSNDDRQTDVRVIAATNRNLERMVARREFREDLYYRLNVVAIALPPLRDRAEDIRPLVDRFLDEFSTAYGGPRPVPDPQLMAFLESHPWPGNIRQLRNCVESMFVLGGPETLTMDDLPAIMCHSGRRAARVEIPADLTLEEVEKAAITQALERFDGNRTHAARSLGISVRTLQRRLNRWGNGLKGPRPR